jgi:hypothetical protein
MEEKLEFELDTNAIDEMAAANSGAVSHAAIPFAEEDVIEEKKPQNTVTTTERSTDDLVNCLSNRKVIVQYIPQRGTVSDPKHVMYGGLAEGASITLTVPRLRSGVFKNVLTDAEKNFLEYKMGLEPGALNVYNKHNNFWDNTTEGGISKVRLTKQDTILDLSSPVDYIKYKILLANTDFVAPNQQVLQDRRKATYKFVLITENEVNEVSRKKMNAKIQSYIEYGKVSEDADILRTIIEIITSKPLAKNSKLDFLQTKVGELIEANAKLFLSVITDPLLKTRVLIKNCVEQGFISKRGDFYYLRSDNTPLCEGGEDPVLSNAAKYLSNPKRQEMKFALEAKLKE